LEKKRKILGKEKPFLEKEKYFKKLEKFFSEEEKNFLGKKENGYFGFFKKEEILFCGSFYGCEYVRYRAYYGESFRAFLH
jgi:hypothetical protein